MLRDREKEKNDLLNDVTLANEEDIQASQEKIDKLEYEAIESSKEIARLTKSNKDLER